MNKEKTYPYSLENAFIISLNIHRIQQLPANIEMPINVDAKVTKPGFPKLQVIIRASTPEDTPVPFNLELVGLFNYIGEQEEYNNEDPIKFVLDRGLHMLWPYISQMLRIITGQMGMNPINIKTPINYSSDMVQSSDVGE